MEKENRLLIIRLITSALLVAAGLLCPLLLPSFPEVTPSILFIISYIISGYDIVLEALEGLIHGELLDESLLMVIGSSGALIIGELSEACLVLILFQLGELFEDYAEDRSRRNIEALMDLKEESTLVDMGETGTVTMNPEDVLPGTLIVLRPGCKLPLDGIVEIGSGTVNTAALTGESLPRYVEPGDTVLSGFVNGDTLLKVRTTKTFSASAASEILHLVEDAADRKTKAERFISKFSRFYTPSVCIIALLIFLIPTILYGYAPFRLQRALSLLVISCPCAMVISIPLTYFCAIGYASSAGILIKGSSYLEALRNADVFAFDKTGTLTNGHFTISQLLPFGDCCADRLSYVASAAESLSTHPLGLAVLQSYPFSDADIISDFKDYSGQGVSITLSGKIVLAGSSKLVNVPESALVKDSKGPVIYVSEDNVYLGAIILEDTIKPGAEETISYLRCNGVKTLMLTGDDSSSAEAVARTLGVDCYLSGLMPQDKLASIETAYSDYSESGICFIGDGINDAPVLMRADVGIAMGTLGSDAAVEAADIVIMDDNISKVVLGRKLSEKCFSVVKENIIFTLCAKLICLVLSSLSLVGMAAAVFADVGVLILAVINSLRLMKPIK